jgi:hypothetical protein
MSACQVERDMTITDNPPKSPFFKGRPRGIITRMSTSASLTHTYTQVNRSYEILSTKKPTLVSRGKGKNNCKSDIIFVVIRMAPEFLRDCLYDSTHIYNSRLCMISISFLKNLFRNATAKQANADILIAQKFAVIRAANQSIRDFPTSPVSKRTSYLDQEGLLLSQSCSQDNSFRIKLYRFLRDNIPILNSAIWTWTRICSSPNYFELKGSEDPSLLDRGSEVIRSLDRRIYQHSFQKFGGTDALLTQFFRSLFTDGAVCGELVLTPSQNRLDKFYFIDPATIRFKLKDESTWELFQEIDGTLVRLNPHSTFYLGLDPDSDDPRGKSILGSIPFVARVEQRLLEDMQKTMHNAGYHRLHVKIKPPERVSGESDENYLTRANKYFEDTVEMMRELAPEDNPITWSDVQIEYICPSGHISSSHYWYINHKALIEDICAGVHLDPSILGYSYGLTKSWAQFKYELILQNVVSIQRCAKRFLEWIRNIELALWGLPLECEHHFDNRKFFGMLEQREAEKINLENVIRKKEAGLITEDQAKRELENVG